MVKVLKENDKRKNYDIHGHISFKHLIKVLQENGTLIRGEEIEAVYLTENGIGYYAKLEGMSNDIS